MTTRWDRLPHVTRRILLPGLVFVAVILAFMPRALTGQATALAVDLMEGTAPYRDAIERRPEIVSPAQADQPEGTPLALAFNEGLREGRFQLWDPLAGGGTPLGSTPLNWMLSPFNVVFLAFPAWYAVTLRLALNLLAAQLGTYLLVRRLGARPSVATLAGVAFAFSGGTLSSAHRFSGVFLVPLLLWAVHRATTRPSVGGAAIVAGATAWMWLEGFPSAWLQSLYLGAALAVWLTWRWAARTRPGAGVAFRRIVAVGLATGGGMAWGLALSAVNLLPFLEFIGDADVLASRGQDAGSHLPARALFGIIDQAALGSPTSGPWWQGINPVESGVAVGVLVSVVLAAGVLAAARGRLRIPAAGRDAWPFLLVASVLYVFVTYTGTFVLVAVLRLPGLGENPLSRTRPALCLCLVVLAALVAEGWLAGRDAAGAEAPPRRTTAAVGALAAVLVAMELDDVVDVMWQAQQGREVLTTVARNAVLAGVAVAVFVAARRRRALTPVAVAAATVVLFVQLAVPYRGFTPEAPKALFYVEEEGHRVLAGLTGREYRFAGTGGNFLPDSSLLFGAPDLRGLLLRTERFKDLVEAANPDAFARDPLKILLSRDEWRLGAPAYDALSVRYFVLGTAEEPYGLRTDVGTDATGWEATVDGRWSGTIEPGPAVTGVAVPMRVGGDACERARIGVTLTQGSVAAESGRPAYDAVGDWLSFALMAQLLDAGPATLTVTSSEPGCTVELGVQAPGVPALRVYRDDPVGPVRLAAVAQSWIYERPSALPIVRVAGTWGTAPDRAAAVAPLADGSGSATVPVVVGTDLPAPDPAAPAPRLLSADLGDDVVRARVAADATALVVVAQSDAIGWSVQVDGRPADLVSVHGALQGVFVPAGEHDVTFRYAPDGFLVGRWISIAALAALVAVAVSAAVRRRRDRHAAGPTPVRADGPPAPGAPTPPDPTAATA